MGWADVGESSQVDQLAVEGEHTRCVRVAQLERRDRDGLEYRRCSRCHRSAAVRSEKGKNMTIEVINSFLLWCAVINYGVLLVWFLVFVFAHDWILRVHGRWFRLSRDQFDTLHYAGMSIFKIGIILFNLVPFVVLSMLR